MHQGNSNLVVLYFVREHENRDGLADQGIFGGRSKHSLVIQASGELTINKTNSAKSPSHKGMGPSPEGADDDSSLAYSEDHNPFNPTTMICPHCTETFDLAPDQLEDIRAALQNQSKAASRRPSGGISQVVQAIVETSDDKKKKKKKKKHHKYHRRLDPVTMEPLPLLSEGILFFRCNYITLW